MIDNLHKNLFAAMVCSGLETKPPERCINQSNLANETNSYVITILLLLRANHRTWHLVCVRNTRYKFSIHIILLFAMHKCNKWQFICYNFKLIIIINTCQWIWITDKTTDGLKFRQLFLFVDKIWIILYYLRKRIKEVKYKTFFCIKLIKKLKKIKC